MNRHARRASQKRIAGSIRGLSEAADKLDPFMAQMGALKAELERATAILSQTQSENAALQSALNMQRAVYLRLFAQGMGVSLDTVVSMADGIEAQLTQGETHDKSARKTTEAAEGDSSA